LTTVTTLHDFTEWKSEARKNLEYARRLRYTYPKLCMLILIDVLDDFLKRSDTKIKGLTDS
jgi:hypothetical protein